MRQTIRGHISGFGQVIERQEGPRSTVRSQKPAARCDPSLAAGRRPRIFLALSNLDYRSSIDTVPTTGLVFRPMSYITERRQEEKDRRRTEIVEAAEELSKAGISLEVIDVQTLLPFDRKHLIVESIKKTNRVVFADEDVPGGATSFMMQQVLEGQQAYNFLDSIPLTITAKEHRPAYASDGDYFTKPNVEDVFEKIYAMMRESSPDQFPALY